MPPRKRQDAPSPYATDMIHLASAGIWGGGAIVLLIVLVRASRGLDADRQRRLVANAVPRFSMLALTAWIMLAATGGYSAWLEVANVDGALNTTYGNAFLIKMALAALLLGFGAAHLIVVSRRSGRLQRESPGRNDFKLRLALKSSPSSRSSLLPAGSPPSRLPGNHSRSRRKPWS